MNTKKTVPFVFDGCILCDGVINVTIRGKKYNLHTAYLGGGLRYADPKAEVVLMTTNSIPYDELETGFILPRCCTEDKIAIKSTPKSYGHKIINLNDVIAWGYVDGGLNVKNNPYSCVMRPAKRTTRSTTTSKGKKK